MGHSLQPPCPAAATAECCPKCISLSYFCPMASPSCSAPQDTLDGARVITGPMLSIISHIRSFYCLNPQRSLPFAKSCQNALPVRACRPPPQVNPPTILPLSHLHNLGSKTCSPAPFHLSPLVAFCCTLAPITIFLSCSPCPPLHTLLCSLPHTRVPMP